MAKSEQFLTMNDGVEIFIRLWEQVQSPHAVLQLAHGMAEHIGRYDHFAQACNQERIIVIGSDHRGHGRTGENSGVMGYFAPSDGFDRVVEDLYLLNKWATKTYPNLPIFLLGHSMGSFLARRYLQNHAQSIKGAILLGSGGDPGFAAKFGKAIARWQMKKDPTQPSTILDKMSFGSFNKGINNPKTKFDWLTRDPQIVDDYINDPYCGMVCSSGFFYDLFTGLGYIHDPALNAQIPADFPLLVLSGEADPVGKRGKGVRQFIAQYENVGLKNITKVLFPHARHELLNEKNKEEVIATICQWMAQQISAQ